MKTYDVVIVGSGFGGAVAAYELSRAGLDVCLLERGPWFASNPVVAAGIDARPFPRGLGFFHRAVRSITHPLFAAKGICLNACGMLEMFASHSVSVVCANGVGGGSHAYSGLHGRPLDSHYWDKVSAGLSEADMAPHYQAVLQQFGSNPAPHYAQYRDESDRDYITDAEMPPSYWGYRADGADTQQPWHHQVNFLQEGMFGSPNGGKISLAESYILPAIQSGLDVQALQQAREVKKTGDGFVVETTNLENGRTQTFAARQVVMSAGCINTLKILQASVEAGAMPAIPTLGQKFSTNADVMAMWLVNDKRNNAADGPYQKVYQPRNEKKLIQILQAGISGLASIPMPAFLRVFFQRQLFLAAMGEDNSDGEVCFRSGKLHIDFDVENDEALKSIKENLRSIAARRKKALFIPRKITTVHPLGGAVIGDHAATSVVNAAGEVHNIPGLYITDASVFPRALAAPPSWSIAAWSRHVSLGIVAGHGNA